MKTNWQIKKLGEIVSVVTGKLDANAAVHGGKFPFYTCSAEESQINETAFDGESVLLSGNGIFLVKYHESGKFNAYQRVYVIKSKNNDVFLRYIYFFLTIEVPKLISQGAVIKYLRLPQLTELEIPLPPLQIQKEIVAKLDEKFVKLKKIKEIREKALDDTEKILSQTLHEIFEDGRRRGWEEKNIGDIFVFNYGKGLSRFERSVDGKYVAYGANGELGKSDKFLVDGECIVVGRKGSAGEVTRVSGKFWPTDVTYFIIENKKYNIDFAYYLFKYLDFTRYAKGVKPGINRNDIYRLSFLLPSIVEQKEIVTKLDKLSKKIRSLKELQKTQIEDLKKLEKSYLKEAFNGELV